MNILDEKTGDLSNEPAFCHLRGIGSGSLLYLPNKNGEVIQEEEFAIGLWMVGLDSRAFKKAISLNQQKAEKSKKINIQKETTDELVEVIIKGEALNAEVVVGVTTGWKNFTTSKGGVIEFTRPLLKAFFIANPGYKEQGIEFYTDRANHLGNV